MTIPERIAALRRGMAEAGLDAYIITGSDPHGSEIPPERWRTREWISGFTGSAGWVLITADSAGLWTDFRYWIQAERELAGSGVDLFRLKAPGVPSLETWLANHLQAGAVAGVDGRTITAKTAEEWIRRLDESEAKLVFDIDLISPIWGDRPPLPARPVRSLKPEIAGESRKKRLARLSAALKDHGADIYAVEALDNQAWLLNIRGDDVRNVPVAVGYLLKTPQQLVWFTDESRVPDDVRSELAEDGVSIAPYGDFTDALSTLGIAAKVFLDPATVSRALLEALPEGITAKIGDDPVLGMKSIKNPVEIARTREAMVKDGVALCRFYYRLEKALDTGETVDEAEAAERLHSCRAEIPGFLGDSFGAIVAFGPNGAMNHYQAVSGTAAIIDPAGGILLIDSGGHYAEGSTDITRTTAIGKPTEEQIRDYTVTLRGHIGLSTIRFPTGTRGYQLDAIARRPLWERGVDFGHGTGHGVGYLLNVHEGPQKLNNEPIDQAVEAGMIVSNEPGTYREGSHGIRIENLLLCREGEETPFGVFHDFETLTLAPYDRSLIDVGLLEPSEREWLEAYHSKVYDALAPELEKDVREWLEEKTRPL